MNYSVSRGFVCLSLSLLLLVALGCSDDDPATPPGDDPQTVTISVDESSLCFDCDLGIVFTSALDGTVLDYATWTGAAELALAIPATLGTGFYVTRVDDSSSGSMTLASTAHEVADNLTLDWTRDDQQVQMEEADFQFANIPDHSKYYIGSGSTNMIGGQLFADTDVYFYSHPADVLVVLEGATAPRKFKWVDGVTPGNTYPVDLQDMDPMQEYTVGLPAAPNQIRCGTTAYREAEGDLPWRNYMLSHEMIRSPVPPTWPINFLDSGFDGYNTVFEQITTGDPQQTLIFQTEGGLPESVTFWNLTLVVTDDSIDGCVVQPSEPVQEMELSWANEGTSPEFWNLEVPDYNQPVVLPLLPEDLMALYPDLNREDFALQSVLASRTSEGLSGDGTTPMEITDRVRQDH